MSAIDYYAEFKVWVNHKIIHNMNLLKYIRIHIYKQRVPNVHADLVKHKYIFDMGYPYYMKVR